MGHWYVPLRFPTVYFFQFTLELHEVLQLTLRGYLSKHFTASDSSYSFMMASWKYLVSFCITLFLFRPSFLPPPSHHILAMPLIVIHTMFTELIYIIYFWSLCLMLMMSSRHPLTIAVIRCAILYLLCLFFIKLTHNYCLTLHGY